MTENENISLQCNIRYLRINQNLECIQKSNSAFILKYERLWDLKENLIKTLTSVNYKDKPEMYKVYALFLQISECLKLLRKRLDKDALNLTENMRKFYKALKESKDSTGNNMNNVEYDKMEEGLEKAREAYRCINKKIDCFLMYIIRQMRLDKE